MRVQGSVYFRGPVAWIKYRHPVNGPIQTATPYRSDELGEDEARKQARATLDQILADIAAGVEVTHGPLTFGEWVTRWTKTRAEGHTELGMFRKHCKLLMPLALTAIKPATLRAWVASMESGAPRSIWHRWSNVRTALRDAVVAEHIAAIPLMPPDAMPAKVDADPERRERAVFTLAECEALMLDERIDMRRRVLYAIKALTGARHGEAVGLRWSSIDWAATPRPKVIISRQYEGARTKTLATKIVPLHPALEAILNAWRAQVTERDGREPAQDAFIVADATGLPESSGIANGALQADLATLGLRSRNGHDFRATFVSELLRASAKAGVAEYVVKSITHAKATGREAFDLYKRVPYEAQCEAILSLRVRTMHIVAGARVTSANQICTAGAGVASESSYISATVPSASAEVGDIDSELARGSNYFPMTELGTHEVTEGNRGKNYAGLRVVPAASEVKKGNEGKPQCSDVAATPASDPRLDALEAAARALLLAVDAMRRS